MEDKLKDLRKMMKKTVLKEVRFREDQKNAVLQKIYNDNPKKKLMLFPKVVSIAFTCLCLFSFSYFIINETDFNDDLSPHQGSYNTMPQSEVEQEENYSELSKNEAVELMLNSVDNFKTAEGTIEIQNYIEEQISKTSIEYQLSLENGFYIKESTKNQKTQELIVNYRVLENGKLWTKDEEGHINEEMYEIPSSFGPKLTIESAFSTDNENNQVTNYRERPYIGLAASSLYPYEITANFLRDPSLWEIEKQNEKLLQHNTIVLRGELNPNSSKKHNATSFRFWVDKDTGILLKYETYNDNGDIVEYLYTEELHVNGSIKLDDINNKLLKLKGK